MENDYQISKDGTIFQIKEDGSISKLGKIKNGKIVGQNSATTTSSDNIHSAKGVLIFLLIFFLGFALFVLGTLYHQAINKYESIQIDHQQEVYKLKKDMTSLSQERDQAIKEFSDFKENLGISLPFYITDVHMGNVYYDGRIETQYGAPIRSANTMFLAPRIFYVGVVAGNRKLYVKLFHPDGTLSIGTSSPKGYSMQSTVYIGTGRGRQELGSWGNSSKGSWSAGNYRIEIWYNNGCIFTKTFTIY